MKAYLGSESIAPRILDLGTKRRWVVSFTNRERAPGTRWIGGWVGPRAGLEAGAMRKIASPCRDKNSRSSSPQQPSAIPLSYRGYPLLYNLII